MGFTTPCFIRANAPELRKQLEELGYKYYGNPFQITDTSRLITTLDGKYVPYNVQLDNSWMDCAYNEPLFLAIAALRDDSGYMQWFTDGDNWILCTMRNIGEYWSTHKCSVSLDTIHKATVEELINHFKK